MKERVRGIFTKEWLEVHGNDVFAYSGLVLCILVFSILPPILRGINILDPAGLAFKSIVKDGVMYSILAAGAVFVYSLGAMDISVGAQISMYAILLIHTYNVGGSSIGALVGCVALIFVIAMVCGITNSVIANVLEMKPIITSLILQFLIYGIASVVINIWNPASIAITFDIGTVAMTHFPREIPDAGLHDFRRGNRRRIPLVRGEHGDDHLERREGIRDENHDFPDYRGHAAFRGNEIED